MLVTSSEHCLTSQHVKGKTNLVADLLSWLGNVRAPPHPLALDDPSDGRAHTPFPLSPPPADSTVFQTFSAAQRRLILDHAGFANGPIVLDSKQEAGHETEDQVWRRWKSYCTLAGIADDPFLVALSYKTKHLLLRSFFGLCRDAKWGITGRLEGQNKEPLVSGTIRTAASCLAASFRNDFHPSPIHIEGNPNLHPGIKALFKAFGNADPPTRREKAITPKLLRKLLDASHHSALLDTAPAVIADLVIGAFFFAMRACECTKPRTAGRTKCVDLAGIVFRTVTNTVIEHDDPKLLELAEHITITFVNQKKGLRILLRHFALASSGMLKTACGTKALFLVACRPSIAAVGLG